ncbi:hypothetical protein D3C83_313870 [compost metagenome]
MLDDHQGPPAGMMGMGQTGAQGPQDLAAADQNGDGSITREEFSVGMVLPGLTDLLAR